MYDPEGALASIPTVMTVWLGTHFGRTPSFEGIGRRVGTIAHWLVCACLLVASGVLVHFTSWPMNKQLWSPSYLLFMAGTCGLALTVIYTAIDINPANRLMRKVLFPLEMMGMNAILVFFWHGPAYAMLNMVYISPPTVGTRHHRPVGFFEKVGSGSGLSEGVLGFITDLAMRQLVWVFLKVLFFFVITWLCYRNRYFWKI